MTETRDTGMNSLYDDVIIITLSIYNTFTINRFVCAQDWSHYVIYIMEKDKKNFFYNGNKSIRNKNKCNRLS